MLPRLAHWQSTVRIWLLFLTQATKTALSLLVIGVVPVGLYVMRNAAARVTRGQWLLQGEEISAVSAIADRCILALVVVAAAFALIEIWQIDMAWSRAGRRR